MSRIRVYLKPKTATGAYSDSFQEITEYVEADKIGSINEDLDFNDYETGIFQVSQITLNVRNESGKFSHSSHINSIFPGQRDGSIIKITWDKADFDPMPGFFKGYTRLSHEVTLFEGLIADVSSSQSFREQSLRIRVLGYESIFDREMVPLDSISDGDTVSEILYACLNQSAITSLLTVSEDNIDPSVDSVIDDKSDLENKTVKQAVEILLRGSNSVLYIKNGEIHISDRAPGASVVHTFYGQAATDGIEDIIDIPKYTDGFARIFNTMEWATDDDETPIARSDATSILTYGVRKPGQRMEFKAVTDTTKREAILDSYVNEFRNPKIEMEIEAPLNYQTYAIGLLDRVNIDFPTMYQPAPGQTSVSKWGQVKWGQFRYGQSVFSFSLETSTHFKVVGKQVDPSDEVITFFLREI